VKAGGHVKAVAVCGVNSCLVKCRPDMAGWRERGVAARRYFGMRAWKAQRGRRGEVRDGEKNFSL
jgi:hypothetical protein